ncbi:carbon monoxide dehydrogenase subunit G [Neobacillus niacini]|uniref:SRPBCC family protein n=1 Tax=Neobacillus niacini TaxID=86668 RepID=UPI002866D938|nr:carbon monoxide dehydrogenase subunit G [Neobacillus niacini]MDR7079350.1 carbon monoxide dehydrogenase subunit G [Neobacillus niacini]
MNLEGEAKFSMDVNQLWDSLLDEEILKKVIPGCHELVLKENGEYDVVLKLGVAAVKGEYIGKVKIEGVDKPNYYILHASGSGSPGHVEAQMHCRIFEMEGGSRLEWKCDAVIGGTIASVGNRVLGGVAKFLAGKFFKDIQKVVKAVSLETAEDSTVEVE